MSASPPDFSGEAYGAAAALRYRVFESRPSGFAQRVAPMIRQFYERTEIAHDNRDVLDVACGTGQLAAHFLEHGFSVVGLDRSPHMLRHARDINAQAIDEHRALFIRADATEFRVGRPFGLVACTFNVLNHLPSVSNVRRCLACVSDALAPGGYLVFDINTRLGLRGILDTIEVHDTDEEITVRNRVFAGERVVLHASGCFVHRGVWHRYRETIFKIALDTDELRGMLRELGWASVTYTDEGFAKTVANPEEHAVAYGVAQKLL